MGYTFHQQASVSSNVSRVYNELLKQSIEHLANSYGRSHTAVHETRKCFKKIRALLRLIRFQIGEETYQAYNQFFRDEARKISVVRDVNVLIETLDKIKNSYQETLSDDIFTGFRTHLLRKKHALSKKVLYRKKALQKMQSRLEEIAEHLPPLTIGHNDFSVYCDGIKKIFKQAKNGLLLAGEKRTVETFHDWRKRVKYLRYQTDLLSMAWPAVLSLQEKEMNHLTDLLGDHHDLAVLQKEILKIPIENPEVLDILLGLIHQRKTALEEEAFPLGARLFADKPKSFVNRLKTYWTVWKNNPQLQEQ